MNPVDPTGQPGLVSARSVIKVDFMPMQPQTVPIGHRPKVPFWMPNVPAKKNPQLFPGSAGLELNRLPPNFRSPFSLATAAAIEPVRRMEQQVAPLWKENSRPRVYDPGVKRRPNKLSQGLSQRKQGCEEANVPAANLKQAKFTLAAPWAKSVKLAADFTAWQKYPLDMIKGEDGVWHIVVWVLPGQHTYRFIVDDQWYDDPNPGNRVANPFGGEDALIQVE